MRRKARQTQMDRLKVAVIGAGRLGSIHARVYSQLDNVRLAGVCDCNSRRAKKVARKSRTTSFVDYRDLFGKVDAVSIVVPTNLHHQIAKDFLMHDINVLVEKPITRTLQEANELLKIAEDKGLILQVGHIERFNSAARAINGLSDNPKFIECHRLGPYDKRVSDVGVVLDLMIHDIDMVLGLVNSKVEKIDAIGVNVLSNYEDIANARIRFRNNTICDLTASRVTEDITRKIRIFQKDAYISLDYVSQSALLYKRMGGKITKRRINIKKEEPLRAELDSFINCVKTRERPLVSGEEGRDALKIALEIVDKIEQR